MSPEQPLAPAVRLALAWQPAPSRPALSALFALDRRLADAVAAAKEPMLAQIRMAWWRERLGELTPGTAPPEPLLAAIAATWGSQAHDLTRLVEGWEARLLDPSGAGPLIEARADALASYARLAGSPGDAPAAAEVGRRWARAELGLGQGRQQLEALRFSRGLRGIAVLGALATRALERGETLLAGRGAVLDAWRVGLLGR